MKPRCPICGNEQEPGIAPCVDGSSHVLVQDQCNVRIDERVGLVMDGPNADGDGHLVESRPASGGRAVSKVNRAGAYEAELSEPLDRGRGIEPDVVRMLVELLRARGETVAQKDGAKDCRGEDQLLTISGRGDVVVQIVTLPVDEILWKSLGNVGSAAIGGSMSDAVNLVRDALERKRSSAAGTILALAATHLGAIVGESLVREYLSAYCDPADEFSFAEIWLVGPTAQSSIRLA